jgi:hypothetical protein
MKTPPPGQIDNPLCIKFTTYRALVVQSSEKAPFTSEIVGSILTLD